MPMMRVYVSRSTTQKLAAIRAASGDEWLNSDGLAALLLEDTVGTQYEAMRARLEAAGEDIPSPGPAIPPKRQKKAGKKSDPEILIRVPFTKDMLWQLAAVADSDGIKFGHNDPDGERSKYAASILAGVLDRQYDDLMDTQMQETRHRISTIGQTAAEGCTQGN